MSHSRHQPIRAGSRGSISISNSNNRPSTASSVSPSFNAAALTGAAKAFINGLPPDELARYVSRHSQPQQQQPHPHPHPQLHLPPRNAPSGLHPSSPHTTHHGGPGGLRGTSTARRRRSSESIRSTRSTQSTQSTQSRLSVPGLVHDGTSHLAPTTARPVQPPRTHSNIAASLAAARASPAALSASSPSPDPRARSTAPIRSRGGSDATTASTERLDETPIPATNALVKLYEQKKQTLTHEVKPPPVIASQSSVVLRSPKPLRRPQVLDDGPMPLFPPNYEKMAHDRLVAQGLLKETGLNSAVRDNDDDSASMDSFTSAKEVLSPVKPKPKPSKPAAPVPRRNKLPDENVQPSSLYPDIQLRPPSRDASATAPVDVRRPYSSHTATSHASSDSHRSIAAAYHQMHPRRITPLTTGDDLADAIVASSLASSRVQTPHAMPPTPSLPHKSSSLHSHSHAHSFFSRTPSPPKKGMRHTMRTFSSSDEDEDVPFAKHKKKKLIRKHPNKHHEGDRKRWRDALTERERRRYEGVWAANKGIHAFFTADEDRYLQRHRNTKQAETLRESVSEQVVDVVVRDIWSRSRLPEDVLEQVWDLVDTQNNGRLQKEEFVVGLWLLDQCLKGRKLPVRVTDSVWSSVRFLHGIKVRGK